MESLTNRLNRSSYHRDAVRRDRLVWVQRTMYVGSVLWRHLANVTERSMRGRDTALCRITLSTCLLRPGRVAKFCHQRVFESVWLIFGRRLGSSMDWIEAYNFCELDWVMT